MLVAIFKVHFENGWPAIAEESSLAAQKLQSFMEWLSEHHADKYHELTQHGTPIMLNNGCEFATTFLILLLVLLWFGQESSLVWITDQARPIFIKRS